MENTVSFTWHGFNGIRFEFEGREAILVFPHKADENRNWTLKMEYWDAFPNTELALLEKGFHAAYLKNESRFAPKSDCEAKDRFAEFLNREYGLSEKCVPVGMSLGGAHAMNFAGFFPERVAAMFIDAPVLNFASCPGNFRADFAKNTWKTEFEACYPGIRRADLLTKFDNHPIGKTDIVLEHNIPIVMCYGDQDETVDYEENGAFLADACKDYDRFLLIKRENQGHHPHGLSDPTPIVDFIIDACR